MYINSVVNVFNTHQMNPEICTLNTLIYIRRGDCRLINRRLCVYDNINATWYTLSSWQKIGCMRHEVEKKSWTQKLSVQVRNFEKPYKTLIAFRYCKRLYSKTNRRRVLSLLYLLSESHRIISDISLAKSF